MKRLAKKFLLTLAITTAILGIPLRGSADDFVVYSVYRPLDLGIPGETPQKDYFVNMGAAHGLHAGMTLDVLRKVSSYDLITEKLYRDLTFPIARIKIIHVEPNAAIARLEKMLPADRTPAISPRAVMVGDIVRVAQ